MRYEHCALTIATTSLCLWGPIGCNSSQGCQSDNDCKGDRICVDRTCTSPNSVATKNDAVEPSEQSPLQDSNAINGILPEGVDTSGSVIQVSEEEVEAAFKTFITDRKELDCSKPKVVLAGLESIKAIHMVEFSALLRQGGQGGLLDFDNIKLSHKSRDITMPLNCPSPPPSSELIAKVLGSFKGLLNEDGIEKYKRGCLYTITYTMCGQSVVDSL